MADCDPQRMLLANGDFLTEDLNVGGSPKHCDATMIEDTLDQDLDQMGVSNVAACVDTQHQNMIHPTLDHSYVYSAKNAPYFNTNAETDDSCDAESSESVVEQSANTDIAHVQDSCLKNTSNFQTVTNNVAASSSCKQPNEVSSVNISSALRLVDHRTSSALANDTTFATNFLSTNSSSLTGSLSCTKTNDATNVTETITLKKMSAPLGSVENPIQIVQQGNAYHSTQVLTKEHLQQIAHVLQQQQLAKAIQNGGKSVLYDQTTNTRIVYRVIYPSELQSKNKDNESHSVSSETSVGKSKGRPKKNWMKKVGDEEKGKPLLSKEEREEKKKHRPRTRSGRISKPPSYMVKDYKRIHHLDFNEEAYNDSDGGYSDYHVSDEEKEKYMKKGSQSESTTAKKRNYNCASCSKAYIGKGGLSRHYRLNPNHGSLPEGEDVSTQDENSNSSLASSVFSTSGTSNQGALTISPFAKNDLETNSQQQQPFSLEDLFSTRKRNKLKEILKNYQDDELVQVLLPRLLHSISLWDLLLSKSKKGNTQQLDISSLLGNFEVILHQMQKVVKNYLSSTALANDSGKTVIHVRNEDLAKALKISTGTYFVRDVKSYQFDPLHSYSARKLGLETNVCRSSNIGMTDEMLTPAKLRKMHSLEASVIEEPINSTLPDQILSDVQEVDGLFDTSAELQGHDPSQILSAIPGNTDAHEFTTRTFLECSNGIVPGHKMLPTNGNSTTVTPSSLSSGCLSAIDASEALRTHNFMTSVAGVQQLDNMQLNEVPLFSTTMPNFHSESSITSLETYNNSTSVKAIEDTLNVSIEQQIITSNSDRSLLCFDTSGKLITDQSLAEVQPQGNADNYCPVIEQTSTVDYSEQAAVSLLQGNNVTGMAVVPDCLVNSNSVNDGLCNRNTTADRVMSVGSMPTLTEADTIKFASRDKSDDINAVSFNVPTTASLETVPAIHQLVLPGGQVLGTWSQIQNQSSNAYGDQLIQEHLTPGNLVLVQNPDGSYQVPSEQIIPLETFQALLNANQTVVKEEESSPQLL